MADTPNILWICSDQQRDDTLGCYGNRFVRTPNLDRLAAGGVLFERAFSQSPVCTPSRASFLTGRYPRTCRTRQNGADIPEGVEGVDLSHCVLGVEGPEPEAAFMQGTGATAVFEDGYEWRALRDKRYTYALYRADRSELLYDHQADPYQVRNLARDPAYADVLERFRTMLRGRMAALNDTFEACTWYRDHWTEDRVILRTATIG